MQCQKSLAEVVEATQNDIKLQGKESMEWEEEQKKQVLVHSQLLRMTSAFLKPSLSGRRRAHTFRTVDRIAHN